MEWTVRLPVLLCGVMVVVEGFTAYNRSLVVPRCCRDGYTFAADRSCIPGPDQPFHPLALVGETPVAIQEVENQEITHISCEDEGSVLMYTSTIDGKTYLIVNDDYVGLIWFSPDELVVQPSQFCMAREFGPKDNTEPNYVAKFCYEDPVYKKTLEDKLCANSTCVRKCCQHEEFMLDSSSCQLNFLSNEWKPTFMSDGKTIGLPSDLEIIYGHPVHCENILVYNDHQLLSTGEVLAAGLTRTQQEYCIDYNYNTEKKSVEEIALVCFKDSQLSECLWKHRILKPVLLSVSCVCLALTWCVYMWVRQLRTGNTGRCLITFVTAMFAAFVTIMVLEAYMDLSGFQCQATGRIGHFSILATFFWLNVMSYHIFSLLRSGKQEQQEGTWVFVRYCVYAWGCPLVVVVLGIIFDFTEANFIRPYIEAPYCWFFDSHAKWAYQYGIILLLLIVNIGFFVGSVKALKHRERTCQTTGNPSYTISAWIFLKLFIIMGLLWITEVIVWDTTGQCSVVNTIFDVINGLQGVYVFLVSVVFRRDLKVFHCGLPKLVSTYKGGERTTNPQEASELVGTPTCKD